MMKSNTYTPCEVPYCAVFGCQSGAPHCTGGRLEVQTDGLVRYDAGLLGDGGGGDVDWWQDYIRAELERAHEFYCDQHDALQRSSNAEKDGALRAARAYLRPAAKVAQKPLALNLYAKIDKALSHSSETDKTLSNGEGE